MERPKGNGATSDWCRTGHRYFVTETGAIADTGEVFVIYLCTSCGDAHMKKFPVTAGPARVELGGRAGLPTTQPKE